MFYKNSTDLLQHKNLMSIRADEAQFCKDLCSLPHFISSLPFFCALTNIQSFFSLRLREDEK